MHQDHRFEELLKVIGENLRLARVARRQKQETVSSSLHLSRSTISEIENGKCRHLTFQMLFRLLEFYGLEFSQIVCQEAARLIVMSSIGNR